MGIEIHLFSFLTSAVEMEVSFQMPKLLYRRWENTQ